MWRINPPGAATLGGTYQAKDATLTAWATLGAQGLPYFAATDTGATLTLAADKGIYATGAGALATYDLTAVGRTLLAASTVAAQRAALSLDTGNSPTFTDLHVSGNLFVAGTTTVVSTERMDVAANYVFQNTGYTADTAQTGGLVVNYDPTTTTTNISAGGFVAGVAGVSNPTVTVASTTGFATADIIQVAGSTSNDGFYEVLAIVSGTVLRVRGVGLTACVESWALNQFTAESGTGTVTKVAVSILRTGTDGIWETGKGSATPITYTDIPDASSSKIPLLPAFPAVADFANVAAWDIDRETGLWIAATSTVFSTTVADFKGSPNAGWAITNSSKLDAADCNVTNANRLRLTHTTGSTSDWATGVATAPFAYREYAGGAYQEWVWNLGGVGLTSDIEMVGAMVVEKGTTNNFCQVSFGYLSGAVGIYCTVAANSALTTAGIVAGDITGNKLWARIVRVGRSLVPYYAISTTRPAVGGWTASPAAPVGVLSNGSIPVYAGIYMLRAGTPTGACEGDCLLFDDSGASPSWRNDAITNLGATGLQSTRASTAIPVLLAEIGSTATYSDSAIIAALARAVNTRRGDTATVRAYIYRGAAYTQPADGAGGWVTYSGGTFAGLATVGTGAKLSVWLDASSSGGTQPWSFSPALFGLIQVS